MVLPTKGDVGPLCRLKSNSESNTIVNEVFRGNVGHLLYS